MQNLSTDGQENATFGAKNTNPITAISKPAQNTHNFLKTYSGQTYLSQHPGWAPFTNYFVSDGAEPEVVRGGDGPAGVLPGRGHLGAAVHLAHCAQEAA